MKIFVRAAAFATALAASCAEAALPEEVVSLLDTSVDPCDDFYQYSCGGWLKNFTLPADTENYHYSFGGAGASNEASFKEILQQNWPHVGDFYESCMALDALSALGSEPLQQDLGRIQAAATKEELLEIAGDIGSTGPPLLSIVKATQDPRDATRNVLVFGVNPILMFTDLEYYSNPDKFGAAEAPLREYITWLATLAEMDESDENDSASVADVVIAIEKALSEMGGSSESTEANYLTYNEASTKYPLAFHALVKGRDLLNRSAMTENTEVYVPTPMDEVEAFLGSLDLEDLKLYYSFLYVHFHAPYLGEDFLQARFDFFDKALEGTTERPTRESVCYDAALTSFPDLLGKFLLIKTFKRDREQNVQRMVDAIKKAMGGRIDQLSWLDDATREQATAKLAKVTDLIGYSKTQTVASDLTRDNYFANVQAINAHNAKAELARINQPVDRSSWAKPAVEVGAFNMRTENKILIPAAILQPPFYKSGSHPVHNFGAMGVIIGHELTHAFDNLGRSFDGDGNNRDWLSEDAANEFDARTTCLANQVDQMVAVGDSGKPVGTVNGTFTIADNIADNGGVGLAYDAYHAWARSGAEFDAQGVEDSEVDKLFFLSFGQMWCQKITDDALQTMLGTDEHAPSSARVNGVAMNSDHFAKAFQCKAGSKMNPKHKCKLW